jgi:DNA-binding YbaB/EbfC family protein
VRFTLLRAALTEDAKNVKGNLSQLMQQAQKMQEQMQQAQDELADLEVTGEAGGGLVKLTMTGKHEVRSIHIDDALVGEDREMLEDVLAAAFNDALRRVEKTVADKYSGMTSGLGLPPGMKLPF